jgi:hypothetical protein
MSPMNSDRLARALEEARKIEKEIDLRDRVKEDEFEEALTRHLSALQPA